MLITMDYSCYHWWKKLDAYWCVLAAYACTNANGQPWTGARFPIGSPSYQWYWFHAARVFVCTFFMRWNKRVYVPCPNSAFLAYLRGQDVSHSIKQGSRLSWLVQTGLAALDEGVRSSYDEIEQFSWLTSPSGMLATPWWLVTKVGIWWQMGFSTFNECLPLCRLSPSLVTLLFMVCISVWMCLMI